jgi:hypothetical protein
MLGGNIKPFVPARIAEIVAGKFPRV